MKILLRVLRILRFALYYAWEMVLANFRVAYDVLTPVHFSRPGFVVVPTRARTDLELLAIANLISMTPGTLTVDFSPDSRHLYIHVMFLETADALRAQVRDDFEPCVLSLFR